MVLGRKPVSVLPPEESTGPLTPGLPALILVSFFSFSFFSLFLKGDGFAFGFYNLGFFFGFLDGAFACVADVLWPFELLSTQIHLGIRDRHVSLASLLQPASSKYLIK